MNVKEILKDALPMIQKFAPSIGAAIGGPIGIATGFVLPILTNEFNAHPQNFGQLVTNMLQDIEAPAKLQKLEKEHGSWVSELMDSVNSLAEAEINVKLKWDTQTDKCA
jgi:hypothetical protein